MSWKTTGRAVGACFLLAFVFYVAGSLMVDAGSGRPAVLSAVADHETLIASGALLMLMNSVVVAAVGVLVFPLLRRFDEAAACGYLVCRSAEAVLLAVGTVFLLLLVPLGRELAAGAGGASELPALARVAQQGNHYAYQVGMIALGLGGLVLCRVLLRFALVPGPLALLGLFGYTALVAGAVLETLGVAVGVVLSVPGGLFEVALGVLLLTRGFPPQDHDGAGRDESVVRSAPAALTGVR